MSPATVWLCRQLIRHAKAMLASCDDWVRRTEESAPSIEMLDESKARGGPLLVPFDEDAMRDLRTNFAQTSAAIAAMTVAMKALVDALKANQPEVEMPWIGEGGVSGRDGRDGPSL